MILTLDVFFSRPVLPHVEPGYLAKLLPDVAPERGESWKDVLKDVDRVIMPGITHWHSPNFHAYYPAGNSFPSMVGELMSAGLGIVGINWVSWFRKSTSNIVLKQKIKI